MNMNMIVSADFGGRRGRSWRRRRRWVLPVRRALAAALAFAGFCAGAVLGGCAPDPSGCLADEIARGAPYCVWAEAAPR